MIWYILTAILIIVAVVVAIKVKKKKPQPEPTPEPEPKPEPQPNVLWKNARTIVVEKEGSKIMNEPINITGETNVEIVVEGDKDAVVVTPTSGKNLKSATIEVLPNENDNPRTINLTIKNNKES